MIKLCIIDIDGVVADGTARFQRAEEAKQAYEQTPESVMRNERKGVDIYWQTAFTPELVQLDTPIEGVDQALMDIQERGYKVIFLTSRPESMSHATVQWLFEHTVYDSDDELVLKAPAFKYTKTPVWKAGMVQTLAHLYGATVVKFIDDEQANWEELLKYTPYADYSLEWFSSLKAAVESIAE